MSNPNEDSLNSARILVKLDRTHEVIHLYEVLKPQYSLEEFIESRKRVNPESGEISYLITTDEYLLAKEHEMEQEEREILNNRKTTLKNQDPKLYELFYGKK